MSTGHAHPLIRAHFRCFVEVLQAEGLILVGFLAHNPTDGHIFLPKVCNQAHHEVHGDDQNKAEAPYHLEA